MASIVETPESAIPVVREHIVQTPGTCGGKPRIAGHRIKVQHVVIWHERMGLSVDEIVAQYPQLTFAELYSALAYYWDHKDQIDADIRADESFAAELRAKSPPSLLKEKLKQRHAEDDSVSPG